MRSGRFIACIVGVTLVVAAFEVDGGAQLRPNADAAASGPRLAPTDHPPLPGDLADYFFVSSASGPNSASAATESFAQGVRLVERREYESAASVLGNRAPTSAHLLAYSRYYQALALRRLDRLDEASALLIAVAASGPTGYLELAVPLLRAEIAETRKDHETALAVLEALAPTRSGNPEAVLERLASAAEGAGEIDKAIRAYRRVYFEYPLSEESARAAAALTRLRAGPGERVDLVPLELSRAEALFAARRWSDAREAFAKLLPRLVRDMDRELAGLRVAECDYYLKRTQQARVGLEPYVEQGSRVVEARYFAHLVTKALGNTPAYVLQAKQFTREFPSSAWTEEVLNSLATHYVVTNDDAAADDVFRELVSRFPRSRYAERAAWKVGWTAYRRGNFAETAKVFDQAAAYAPRADYRPSWLYWSARAYEQLGVQQTATARYRLAATDYLNSYYGRLASKWLSERGAAVTVRSVAIASGVMPSPLIPSSALVRDLVRLSLFDDALRELDYAERVWGSSSAIQATTAWIRSRRAGELEAMERFQSLRGAINLMKRAYPQYLAAGGEHLPVDVLRVIYPLDYWSLIRAQAEQRGLDPYLMAALVAQESTFTADIRSSANAVGLMQLIPSTGRLYASKVGLRGFVVSQLRSPETNVRLGMTYFKDLVDRFGHAYLALASYNAGENRVARWMVERPGLPQDEFIDDIPFPETQNYVKRILGTAEDYRRLYGESVVQRDVVPFASPRAPALAVQPPSATPATRPTTRAVPTPRTPRSR